MKRLSIILLSVIISTSVLSQDKFGSEFNASLSAFYYWEAQGQQKKYFEELSITPNFNININRWLFIGLRTYIVKAKGNYYPKFASWHYIIEPHFMFKAINKKRFNLTFELGYGNGNYCPNCTPTFKDYNRNLHYINGLIDIQFNPLKDSRNFWILLAFATNNPIKKKNNTELHGFNLPLIGVQYRFEKE